MSKFFSKVWWVIKPLNKWHLALYVICLCLTVYDKETLPPSKVITDYKRVEGVVIKVSRKRRHPVMLLKVDDDIISLSFSGKKYVLYYSWLNKKRVVYYWPKHFLDSSNYLVLATPLQQETDALKKFIKYEDGFNKPFINKRSNSFIFSMFLALWMFPFFMKLAFIHKRKYPQENIFITKSK